MNRRGMLTWKFVSLMNEINKLGFDCRTIVSDDELFELTITKSGQLPPIPEGCEAVKK